MRFSFINAAKLREDRRPLYRRIFTNRRLDILHKGFSFHFISFMRAQQIENILAML